VTQLLQHRWTSVILALESAAKTEAAKANAMETVLATIFIMIILVIWSTH